MSPLREHLDSASFRTGSLSEVQEGLAMSAATPYTRSAGSKSPTELGCLLGVSRQRAHQLLNPAKHRARKMVAAALRTGRLIRPSLCQRCSASTKLHAHHSDYNEPLDVRWLCVRCHNDVHPHPYYHLKTGDNGYMTKRVPVTDDQHRKAKAKAAEMGLTLERFVAGILEDASRQPAEDLVGVFTGERKTRAQQGNNAERRVEDAGEGQRP